MTKGYFLNPQVTRITGFLATNTMRFHVTMEHTVSNVFKTCFFGLLHFLTVEHTYSRVRVAADAYNSTNFINRKCRAIYFK